MAQLVQSCCVANHRLDFGDADFLTDRESNGLSRAITPRDHNGMGFADRHDLFAHLVNSRPNGLHRKLSALRQRPLSKEGSGMRVSVDSMRCARPVSSKVNASTNATPDLTKSLDTG